MGPSNYTFIRKYELYTVCMIFNFQPGNFSVEAGSFSKGSVCLIGAEYGRVSLFTQNRTSCKQNHYGTKRDGANVSVLQ